jgi:transposase
MDNLSAKGDRVSELIEERSCELLYLLPYSLDLNSIEETFSKFKALLQKAGALTREALVERMVGRLNRVTARDGRDFFEHRGYGTLGQ